MDVSTERAHRAWRQAERIKQLSDGLIKLGPWGLGVDGVLAWVPGAGTIYSLGAGALLMYEGFQAGAEPWTLVRMGGYIAVNTGMSDVPVIGWAMDTLFRGHRMAARALQKDIEKKHGRPAFDERWGDLLRRGRRRKPDEGVIDLPQGAWRRR